MLNARHKGDPPYRANISQPPIYVREMQNPEMRYNIPYNQHGMY